MTSTRSDVMLRSALTGMAAGLAGVAAMTIAEKIEQAVTRRPDSYVPGRTLMTVMGRSPSQREKPLLWNHAMHWGTGAALGALRGVWSAIGIRGPRADLAHTAVRLSFDQTVENASGAGAPPHTWPVREQVIDLAHKAVYSFATGVISDRLVTPRAESRGGALSS